jgi:hypothetical protein
MQSIHDSQQPTPVIETGYDAPELTFIGDASEIVLGVAGGGYDGDVGMTEPAFEFEVDDLD